MGRASNSEGPEFDSKEIGKLYRFRRLTFFELPLKKMIFETDAEKCPTQRHTIIPYTFNFGLLSR